MIAILRLPSVPVGWLKWLSNDNGALLLNTTGAYLFPHFLLHLLFLPLANHTTSSSVAFLTVVALRTELRCTDTTLLKEKFHHFLPLLILNELFSKKERC